MLIVEIWVNNELVGRETAWRMIGDTMPDSKNTYELSDGTLLKHRYGDGAARLAEKMCKHLWERKRDRHGKV